MTPPPGQLEVHWATTGVSVRVHPLRRHPTDLRHYWAGAALRWVQLCIAATFPLVVLKLLGDLTPAAPMVLYGVLALFGPVVESAIRWRWENAELTVEIEPHEVRLVHRLGPLPVVTETIVLDELRRVGLHGDGLRFDYQSGRVVREPMPALTDEARAWLLDAIQEARDATADFWRDQVQHAGEQARMQALLDQRSVEPVSPPR